LKRVLITGALGQDGIILSKLYLKKKFKVFGFVKKNSFFKEKKVSYIINNLKSKKKVKDNLKLINPDIVIHLASTNDSFGKRIKGKSYKINYLDNFKCTKNLLNSIVELKLKPKIIFAGSSLMYEDIKKKTVSEKNHFKSSSHYGKYKIDSYNFISNIKKKHKINLTTAILFNHDSRYRNKKFLLPKLIKAFIEKDINFIRKIYKLNISGDFSHAEDVCRGIYSLSLLKQNVDRIIFSSNKRTYINQIIEYLEIFFNFNVKNKLTNNSPIFNILGSNLKASKILNYKVRKNFTVIIKDIIKIYL
jgi:GDP-D-mannose dehydratase